MTGVSRYYGFDVGARPLNHVVPRVGPERFRTFQIAAPHATHYRPATCAEVECDRYLNGWRVNIQACTEAQRQAVLASRYSFREVDEGPDHRYWEFEPGQPCFQADDHRVPTGRPALYLVRDGDWRASTVRHRHRNPEAWRDDLAEHQAHLTDHLVRS